MSSKVTAVEWLVEQLEQHHTKIDIKNTVVFQQAKAMEKEQISEAFLDGVYRASPSDLDYENFKETGEQYYAQNFL
jgi:aldehyde:ferredoxin oxidoreductase